MLRSCRSIQLTSRRFSLGLWGRIGSSILSPSLTLLSTNGSIQYQNTVRYFCFSASADSLTTLVSQMGYNRPEFQGSQMVPPVCKPLQPLLSPPNPNPSAFYTLTQEAVAPVISLARDLYQRGSLVRTCGGSATPPCTTVSFFAFPGAPSPAFYDIPGCLADVFLDSSLRLPLVSFSC